MISLIKPGKFILLVAFLIFPAISLVAWQRDIIVRIAEIEIHADQVEAYKTILKEEAAASVELEPGVIAILPMFQNENPTQIRILEIYADQKAYQDHLKTAHFLYYKSATQKMVKTLKLIDMDIADEETMKLIFSKLNDKLKVR